MNLKCPKCGSSKTRMEGSREVNTPEMRMGDANVIEFPVTVTDTWDFLCFMVQEGEWAFSDLVGWEHEKKNKGAKCEEAVLVNAKGRSSLAVYCRDCDHQIASAECSFKFHLPYDSGSYSPGFKQSNVPAIPSVDIPRAKDLGEDGAPKND